MQKLSQTEELARTLAARARHVVAVGTCACTGGIFKDCYNMIGGMDHAVPVDVYVPGCAARPEAIIDGVVKGLGILEEKRAEYKRIVARRKSAQRKEAT